jgi:hypothetical protein
MKDYIIIGLLVVIALIMLSRNVSGMSPAPGPQAPPNCGSKMINKDLACSDIYPGVYEKNGPITGVRKFCCA